MEQIVLDPEVRKRHWSTMFDQQHGVVKKLLAAGKYDDPVERECARQFVELSDREGWNYQAIAPRDEFLKGLTSAQRELFEPYSEAAKASGARYDRKLMLGCLGIPVTLLLVGLGGYLYYNNYYKAKIAVGGYAMSDMDLILGAILHNLIAFILTYGVWRLAMVAKGRVETHRHPEWIMVAGAGVLLFLALNFMTWSQWERRHFFTLEDISAFKRQGNHDDTRPYPGKVFVIDGDQISALHWGVPRDYRATKPEEVGLVVRVSLNKTSAGSYTDGTKAFRQIMNAQIYNARSMSLVGRFSILGEKPSDKKTWGQGTGGVVGDFHNYQAKARLRQELAKFYSGDEQAWD